MVENDVYNNKSRYEYFLTHFEQLILPAEQRHRKSKYTIKNPKNLAYFKRMIQ